jgi:hypothetical protein
LPLKLITLRTTSLTNKKSGLPLAQQTGFCSFYLQVQDLREITSSSF